MKHSNKKLLGNSRDRRKQLRSIRKANPNNIVEVSADSVIKVINGERLICEEANVPRTIVKII